MDKLFVAIYGAGGHAKVIIDILEKSDLYKVSGIYDDSKYSGSDFFDYIITGNIDDLISNETHAFICIGDNNVRRNVAKKLHENHILFATLIHPSSEISRGVTIGDGVAIMAGVIINADVRIEDFSIINTGATIDHDCIISKGVHIGPGSNLCGSVFIDENSLIGAGTTIIPDVKIGENVVIGAGSTVINDIKNNSISVGSPAKCINHEKQ